MRFFWKSGGGGPSRAPDLRARPFLEQLETRLVPYAVTGGAWPDPQLITLSFMPDGTVITSGSGGTSVSNMYADFGKTMTPAIWQDAILSAAQTWAQYANINFSVVTDDGAAQGTGNYQQGDPGMGDIRFGGYSFNPGYVGEGFLPPPLNNYSIAGDIDFNTAQTFNNGSKYDLQTVALHEIGHALGLDHTTAGSTSVMWASYTTTKRTLSADDIAGIQSIYGARAPDAYASSTSFATAAALTPLVNLTQTSATVNNLDITATGNSEYFSFTTPAAALLGNGTMSVTVQSSGLSLLRPEVNVYSYSVLGGYTLVGTASGSGYTGSTITVNLSGVSALQTYYIQVTGADTTAFGTGDAALSISVGGATAPAVQLPNTTLANGTILQSGGGEMEAVGDGLAVNSSVPDVTLNGLLPGLSQAQVVNLQENQILQELEMLPFAKTHGRGCTCPLCMMAMSNLHAMNQAAVSASMDLSVFGTTGAPKDVSGVTKDLLPAQPGQAHGRKALDIVHTDNGTSHAATATPAHASILDAVWSGEANGSGH